MFESCFAMLLLLLNPPTIIWCSLPVCKVESLPTLFTKLHEELALNICRGQERPQVIGMRQMAENKKSTNSETTRYLDKHGHGA